MHFSGPGIKRGGRFRAFDGSPKFVAQNSERCSGGVAWIISTAALASIASDFPFIDITALSHWRSDFAPCARGLY